MDKPTQDCVGFFHWAWPARDEKWAASSRLRLG